MKLFRIASRRFPIFDGTGAYLHGARWNSPGLRVIYASTSLSGARIEVLVHSGRASPPTNHGYVEIDVPGDIGIETVDVSALPSHWDAVPDRRAGRPVGDNWLKSRTSLLLRVPSVASGSDFNILINQDHNEFQYLQVSAEIPLTWDTRLFAP